MLVERYYSNLVNKIQMFADCPLHGREAIEIRKVGPHYGDFFICGKWIQWLPKKEALRRLGS